MTHTYSQNGYHIALDVYSGSVHLADEVGLLAIRLYETLSREDVLRGLLEKFPDDPAVTRAGAEELLAQLDRLKADGKLYTRDEYAPYAGALRQEKGPVKALCLHVAHACNLACAYCFAGKGDYGTGAALMSEETGRAALDFLVAHSGNRRHLEVDFFGGEPLLNWDVVKRLVAYGRELEKKHGKVFRFTLTTNGVLLDDEVTAFCNREMHNVVLSLDGRAAVHDRFRRDRAGQGSYARVVPNFQRFVRVRGEKGYYMRGTYTRHNLDFASDVLHMADLGFTQLSMEPAVTPPGDENGITQEHLPMLFQEYERLAAEMLTRHREGRGFDFYHFNIDLEHGPCAYKRLAGCGSGTEYLAVTPEGDLYPCHQFVGDERYRMGSLREGIVSTSLREEFRSNNLYAHPECGDCWAKLYCAGGCAANAAHAQGSIRGVYHIGCELFKKRVECAIMLQGALAQDRENAPETAK